MKELSYWKNIKKELLDQCQQDIEQRIQTIQTSLESIESARNNESKSSAGDKFETGRAMMQIEEDKSRRQLQEAMIAKNRLSQINIDKDYSKVEVGSLVTTENGIYFIAIGQGKKTVKEKVHYCISPDAPIGKILFHHAVGDELVFNNKHFKILTIV